MGQSGLLFIGRLSEEQALLIGRIPFYGAVLLCGAIFYFAQIFPRKTIFLPRYINFLIFSLIGILAFLSLFTDLILKDIFLEDGIPQAKFGSLYFLFGFPFLVLVITSIIILFWKYKKLTGAERIQVLYFFIGLSLSLLIGVLANLILPNINPNLHSYRYGPLGVIFFVAFTALAITRYHLFGIKVILTETLVGVMGIILLILPFLMPTMTLKILISGTFLLFLIFGYCLVKATRREVRAKEVLEQKVQERTKDLEKSYQGMRKEKEKLERLYNATVGRELKMAELKNKIGELEEKLRKE